MLSAAGLVWGLTKVGTHERSYICPCMCLQEPQKEACSMQTPCFSLALFVFPVEHFSFEILVSKPAGPSILGKEEHNLGLAFWVCK